MQEVYLGLYTRGDNDLPSALHDERIHGQEPIDELQALPEGESLAAGEGWLRYPELHAANQQRFSALSGCRFPHAKHLLVLGKAEFSAHGAVQPHELELAYLRHKVAEKPTPKV